MEDFVQNILILTDGSECSRRAAEVGIELAEEVEAKIRALNVLETFPDKGVRTFSGQGEAFMDARDDADQAVNNIKSMAAEKGIAVRPNVIEDEHPLQTIRDFIDEHDFDLIVMGTRGRSEFQEYFLGSTTERVIRTSSVPVLAVPFRED